jgi:SAM-dependent methyltransferase
MVEPGCDLSGAIHAAELGSAEYADRIVNENRYFGQCSEVHALPEIFHYWSNKYVKPELLAVGCSNPDELFRKSALQRCRHGKAHTIRRILSLGCGDSQAEIAVAQDLRAAGVDFTLHCLDINRDVLDRGRAAALRHGLSDQIHFIEQDLNEWSPAHDYDVVIANQSLHHILKLEHLFRQIKLSLKPTGAFVISDMIGRNGHQRWPEALAILQTYWRRLPPSYRFNNLLGRYEDTYKDWDCSVSSFEGIRSQDILPLLLEYFHFELFLAFANVIDPFIDRAFGDNFDVTAPWDRAFIDEVHERDEKELAAGCITPTHMFAVVGTGSAVPTVCRGALTPRFCLRDPKRNPTSTIHTIPSDAKPDNGYDWASAHSYRKELEWVCRRLKGLEDQAGSLEDRAAILEDRAKQYASLVEERTAWALRLDRELDDLLELHKEHANLQQEVDQRTNWALQLESELEQCRAWAMRLDSETNQLHQQCARMQREFDERTAWAVQLDKELSALTWARGLDRRFHNLLDLSYRSFRRLKRIFGFGRDVKPSEN